MIPHTKIHVGAKVVCVKNLQHMTAFIDESLCKDKFPVIGKRYTISEIHNGRIALSEFRLKSDSFKQKRFFAPSSFDEESYALMRFRVCNMPEYGTPEFWDKIRLIYKEMAWIEVPKMLYPHEQSFMSSYRSKIAIIGEDFDLHQLQQISDQLSEKFEFKLGYVFIHDDHPSLEILRKFSVLGSGKTKVNTSPRTNYNHSFGNIFNIVKMAGRCDGIVTITENLESLTIEERSALRSIKKPYRWAFGFQKSNGKLIRLT